MTVWPDLPNGWLPAWLVWRVGGGTRPSQAPADIPDYAFDVLRWVLWRRAGKPEPRPDVPKTIPSWAYPMLEAVNENVPVTLPATPHDWLLPWAIWRFRNQPPEGKPSGLPEDLSVAAPYAWSFLRWAAWRRKNPLPDRPRDIPKSIPSWAFALLRQINIAVPPGPGPPPPPPPPPPVGASTWRLPNPLCFTAWGPVTDSRYRDNNEAWQVMHNAGVKTVALQIGQYNADVPSRVRAFGMKVALWGRADPRDGEALAVAKADGYIPQIEGPYEYLDAIRNLEAGIGAGLSLSTVTTLAGLQSFMHRPDGRITTEEVERIKAAGCTHAWVECYKQDGGAHFPISKMMWSVVQRGFDHANPLIGLYRDIDLAEYRPPEDPLSLDSYGKQVGAYLSEGMTAKNWVDFGALGE